MKSKMRINKKYLKKEKNLYALKIVLVISIIVLLFPLVGCGSETMLDAFGVTKVVSSGSSPPHNFEDLSLAYFDSVNETLTSSPFVGGSAIYWSINMTYSLGGIEKNANYKSSIPDSIKQFIDHGWNGTTSNFTFLNSLQGLLQNSYNLFKEIESSHVQSDDSGFTLKTAGSDVPTAQTVDFLASTMGYDFRVQFSFISTKNEQLLLQLGNLIDNIPQGNKSRSYYEIAVFRNGVFWHTTHSHGSSLTTYLNVSPGNEYTLLLRYYTHLDGVYGGSDTNSWYFKNEVARVVPTFSIGNVDFSSLSSESVQKTLGIIILNKTQNHSDLTKPIDDIIKGPLHSLSGALIPEGAIKQWCFDGIDNDGNGLIDGQDPSCYPYYSFCNTSLDCMPDQTCYHGRCVTLFSYTNMTNLTQLRLGCGDCGVVDTHTCIPESTRTANCTQVDSIIPNVPRYELVLNQNVCINPFNLSEDNCSAGDYCSFETEQCEKGISCSGFLNQTTGRCGNSTQYELFSADFSDLDNSNKVGVYDELSNLALFNVTSQTHLVIPFYFFNTFMHSLVNITFLLSCQNNSKIQFIPAYDSYQLGKDFGYTNQYIFLKDSNAAPVVSYNYHFDPKAMNGNFGPWRVVNLHFYARLKKGAIFINSSSPGTCRITRFAVSNGVNYVHYNLSYNPAYDLKDKLFINVAPSYEYSLYFNYSEMNVCPTHYCWNGVTCVPPNDNITGPNYYQYSTSVVNSSKLNYYYTGIFCHDGSWVERNLSFDINYTHEAYCPDNGCLYNTGNGYNCTPQFTKIGNNICDGGRWVGLNVFAAVLLHKLAQSQNENKYVMYCDYNNMTIANPNALFANTLKFESNCYLGGNPSFFVYYHNLSQDTNPVDLIKSSYKIPINPGKLKNDSFNLIANSTNYLGNNYSLYIYYMPSTSMIVLSPIDILTELNNFTNDTHVQFEFDHYINVSSYQNQLFTLFVNAKEGTGLISGGFSGNVWGSGTTSTMVNYTSLLSNMSVLRVNKFYYNTKDELHKLVFETNKILLYDDYNDKVLTLPSGLNEELLFNRVSTSSTGYPNIFKYALKSPLNNFIENMLSLGNEPMYFYTISSDVEDYFKQYFVDFRNK